MAAPSDRLARVDATRRRDADGAEHSGRTVTGGRAVHRPNEGRTRTVVLLVLVLVMLAVLLLGVLMLVLGPA